MSKNISCCLFGNYSDILEISRNRFLLIFMAKKRKIHPSPKKRHNILITNSKSKIAEGILCKTRWRKRSIVSLCEHFAICRFVQNSPTIFDFDLCEHFAIRRFVQNSPTIFGFDKNCQNRPVPLHRETNQNYYNYGGNYQM